MYRLPKTQVQGGALPPGGPNCFDESQIEKLRGAVPEVLERHFGITDLSRSFRCPSPDHEDRTPSAHYFVDKRRVKCFGCGGYWDAFDLAGMALGLDSFPDKVKAVAEVIGCEPESKSVGRVAHESPASVSRIPTAADRPAEPRHDISSQLMDAYDALYTEAGSAARVWLRDCRGITDDDIARYGLGFTLRPKCVMREFAVHEAGAAGFVVIPFWDDDRCSTASYAMLRTVPTAGASARVKEWRPKGVPSAIWQKWALSAGLPAVYVVEGLLDAIAFQKISGKTCVALGGTSMSKKFLSDLEKVPVELRPGCVVVCMDADAAGRRAANEIAEGLDRLCIAHAELDGYPGGVKDANDWLMCEKNGLWKIEHDIEFLGTSLAGGALPPLTRTVWLDVDHR